MKKKAIKIEVSRPGRNHLPGDDWQVKEVRVSTGPSASDLFDALAAATKPPKTKKYAFRVAFEEDRFRYAAAMTVSLTMSGQVFSKARSPFFQTLWRPMVAFGPEAPSKVLAQFSKRSIFSGRIGGAYRPETRAARTKEQQEDALLEAFRELAPAEQRAVFGLIVTGRPSAYATVRAGGR